MRIRSKLVALIAVPLLAIGMIAFAGFRSQSVTIEQAEAADAAIEINSAMDKLVLAIGNERLNLVGGDTGLTAEELQAETDQAFADLEAVNTSERLVSAAADARNLVDAVRGGDVAVSSGMSSANNELLSAAVGNSDDFPTATGYAGAFLNHTAILALEAKEAAWTGYIDADGVSDDSVRTTSQNFGRAGALKGQVEELVAATETEAYDLVLRSASIRRLAELEAVALDDLGEGTRQLDETEVLAALVDFRGEWVSAIQSQGAIVTDLIGDEVSSANGTRSLFTLLAILGAMVMAALIFVIYRSVTQPLENLMNRANIVASEELPDLMDQLRYGGDADELPEATPIPVTTSDEIGELVTAFNDVQLTAYTLASEQAIGRRNVGDMFVNLGRRNQQLLHRILNQLTRLEQKEEDPDTLRELFELDSAVTRMRRNAESLVALAGGHTARQWSKPVNIDNAVRGAFGEVEGYERIEITSLAAAQIQGNVVADLTHLMAELLENAVNFSEPDTTVSVAGYEEGDGYQITILDEGIGMSPAELAENNSRITDPPPLERVPTKFLGLYVVGRLAERHGIGVRLSEAPQRGVMARIDVPAELLGGSRVEEVAPAARRSETAADTSPLEETHDVDAELAAMLPDGDDSGAADGALPVRSRGGSGSDKSSAAETKTKADTAGDESTDDSTDEPAGSKKARSEKAAEPAAEAQETASADAEPAPADDGGLPVRGRKGGTAVKPKPVATTDEKTEESAEPVAEAKADPAEEAAGDARLPVRRTKDSSGPPAGDDGLPTRGRRKDDRQGRSSKAKKKTEEPKTRSSLDQRPATDNSEKSAGNFSSMMSALSTGINRGLSATDTDSTDSDASGSGSSATETGGSKTNSETEGSEG